MDIIEFYNQLPLPQKLLIGSFLFLGLDIIISILRYKKKGEKISLFFRHIAGFIVGVTDQILMIVYGWQPGFVWEFIVWCYAVYTFWLLILPNFLEYDRKYIYIILWLLCIGTLSTIIEMSTWISMYGYLPYPTEPIVWTPIHTWIFYIGVHSLGTFIVLSGYEIEEKYLKKR